MHPVTISLPESLKAFIEGQPAAKGYGYVTEDFGTQLRDAQTKEREVRLKALLIEGLGSERLPLDGDFWHRLEVKTEAIIDKHNPGKIA